jgi:hypothetical protein
MNVTHTFNVATLTKKMPTQFDRTIDVATHDKNFYILDTTDVWTEDGWLVVSQMGENVLGLRKGNLQIVAEMSADAKLHYNSNPKTIHWGL